MKRPWWICSFVLVTLIVVGVAVLNLFPKEPVYQGKCLSEWLRDLDGASGTKTVTPSTQRALRAMGADCLPHLLAMLRAKDSRAKTIFLGWLDQQSLVQFHVTTEDDLRARGERAFDVLGAQAAPAVPELIKMLERDQRFPVRESACRVLGDLGPVAKAAAPVLIDLLNDQEPVIRRRAARALGQLGAVTTNVIPALISALTNSDWYTDEYALLALGNIGPGATNAIPVLVEELRHRHPDVRAFAANALGNMGPAAQSSIPALVIAVQDQHSGVRQAARSALRKIDPEAAAK